MIDCCFREHLVLLTALLILSSCAGLPDEPVPHPEMPELGGEADLRRDGGGASPQT